MNLLDLCEVSSEFRNGTYRRTTTFPVSGMLADQHRHIFDHDTEIEQGRAALLLNGVHVGTYGKGQVVTLKARELHQFAILEAGTKITCIWPEDIDPESAIIGVDHALR